LASPQIPRLDREALIELVLDALKKNPAARLFGGLRREAEERVDDFLRGKQ